MDIRTYIYLEYIASYFGVVLIGTLIIGYILFPIFAAIKAGMHD